MNNINIGEIIKKELIKKDIEFKENNKELIIKCPICYTRDGKYKLKLYIEKSIGLFNCFRCNSIYGTKGNIFKLIKILDKYYNTNLSYYFDTQELLEFVTNNERLLMSDILNTIDNDYIIELYDKIYNNKTIDYVKNNIILPYSHNKNILNYAKFYLNKRNISLDLLRHIPYIIGNKINTNLYYRFGIFSFFKTNFECRIMNDAISKIRYLQSNYAMSNDFIFLLPIEYTIKKSLLEKFNINDYKDINLNSDVLFIVEGLFDCIKLNLFLNKPVISLSGHSKFRNSLIFLKIISLLFKEINIDTLCYILDNDTTDDMINKFIHTINMYKKYLNINVDNIIIKKMNNKIKDIGEINDIYTCKKIIYDEILK